MDERIGEALATTSDRAPSTGGASELGRQDPTLALARALADRLASSAEHRHELRLARALMLDVVELLEGSVAA